MHTHLFFFFFFFFHCYIGLSLVFAEGALTLPPNDSNDVSSLLSIKSTLIDPADHLSDWKVPINGSDTGPFHCNCTGVSCNSNGYVEKLDLSNMNLNGRASDRIQGLHSLAYLNICCNGASGLKFVNASSNNFSGFLPEDLGNVTSLESIDFRGSFFEGSIPISFKNLQNLKFLGLSGNNLTGKIPPELGLLSTLETIILGYNEFEGPIPLEFGNLDNLQYLDLVVGSLSGPIPSELGRLKKLTTVYLYQNRFEGKIPKEIGNMTALVFLDLSDNQISGKIPNEIADLKNLELLNLMCNQLTGPIPSKIGELTKLSVLELWQNSLTGDIPAGLCDSGNLTKLILFNNSFSGPIPLGFSTCSSLVQVRVQNNLISGTIPTGFGNLPKLQRLELANNNLTGTISDDFALTLSLSFIDVSWNRLESSLPSNILFIPSLQNFIASNNNLRGNIPDQFQDCPSLSVLDLSSNHFSGKIPQSIASCERLVNLNLGNNQFTAEIPRPIVALPMFTILDLSNNSLTRTIPENFGSSPALKMLNLSYNKHEGPVPNNGILTTINPNDLIGNVGLCGGNGILPPCSQSFSTTASRQRKRKIHIINHVIVGFAVGISVILSLGLTVFVGKKLYKRWYLYNTFFTDWYKWSSADWPWRLIAFQRLSFTSADILACVKESNVIGMGSTGIVYKAEIERPHSIVAVKKLWRSDIDVESRDDLFREVNLLGRLRHRNIVRRLGYLHNENDVIMVYEYMPNGNLGEALHGENAMKMLVDWVSRSNIAVGVANGLAYLHHDCNPPMIHRDVKSNNILLDADFEAKIANFGLARTMIQKNETVSMVAGSYGYIAPEYGYTLKVDEKSGIYSFGVVLLELTNQMVILKRETFLKGNEGVPCSVIREISFLKEIEHTNIVKLLDIVNKERSVYLVMEYMDLNLRKYMMDTSPDIMKKPRIIKDFLHQILSGLDYCHSHNILHRGLNPGSLILDRRSHSTVKIAGFGSARTFGVPVDVYTEGVETPWYRAPELMLGELNYSSPVDVWSVGCLFAEMVTQQPLFATMSQVEQLRRIFSIMGKPTEETWPGVTSLCPYLENFAVNEPKVVQGIHSSVFICPGL
ncbi:hypothetical protein ACSBR2_007170 [Camellia fascicularis]